jgi:hypothetical protein
VVVDGLEPYPASVLNARYDELAASFIDQLRPVLPASRKSVLPAGQETRRPRRNAAHRRRGSGVGNDVTADPSARQMAYRQGRPARCRPGGERSVDDIGHVGRAAMRRHHEVRAGRRSHSSRSTLAASLHRVDPPWAK